MKLARDMPFFLAPNPVMSWERIATLAADRDAPGFFLSIRIGDHVADAFARMNGDAGVTKLEGGERRSRLDDVVFYIAA